MCINDEIINSLSNKININYVDIKKSAQGISDLELIDILCEVLAIKRSGKIKTNCYQLYINLVRHSKSNKFVLCAGYDIKNRIFEIYNN